VPRGRERVRCARRGGCAAAFESGSGNRSIDVAAERRRVICRNTVRATGRLRIEGGGSLFPGGRVVSAGCKSESECGRKCADLYGTGGTAVQFHYHRGLGITVRILLWAWDLLLPRSGGVEYVNAATECGSRRGPRCAVVRTYPRCGERNCCAAGGSAAGLPAPIDSLLTQANTKEPR
jgi:hypothetical protein